MRLILLLLALVVAGCDRQKAEAPQGEQASATPRQQAGLDRSRKGQAAPAVVFKDPDGGDVALGKFKGVPVLVNLWATWCGPCVKELPTLDKLGDRHAGDGQLAVIAVSQDMAPQGSVAAWLADRKIGKFAAYHDRDMALSGAVEAQILPTTILYDAEGREVWRYVGDLDWTGEEAAKLLAEASPGKA